MPQLDGHGALVDELTRALVENPPLDSTQGGYIAETYDAALDSLRDTARNGRKAIAALEEKYRAKTGITTLKIRHNNVLGYHIEVTTKHADALMMGDSGFTHRQTLAGVVRFNSPDLHEAAAAVTQAGVYAIVAEQTHLETLTKMTTERRDAIAASCAVLARIDVAAALADHAMTKGWCRPQMTKETCLEVHGGRHPVVEDSLAGEGEAFIPNNLVLGEEDRLWLITGPNMGGKSTFLRQNALIVILAQAGSFVPAKQARIGIVDRLFSRVGASDNLARGRSTFMVEMVETAAILAQAGPRSFVILDEVGRGTSTYDGLALAWAVVEAIHNLNRARCLFATHYHELTQLVASLDSLSLHHVRAREWKGDLVLLHELVDGPADRSYGLAVARLAGISPAIVKRAETVLARLEKERSTSGGLMAQLNTLPLFAAAQDETQAKLPSVDKTSLETRTETAQLPGSGSGEPSASDALHTALAAIEPDTLAPRAALDALYRLKDIAADPQSRSD